MPMSLMFEKLGAPLHNKVWSWGAIKHDENIVYLRVWQNETMILDGKSYVQVTYNDNGLRKKAGHKERQRHIELIKSGAECFLIFCEPKKPLSMPRKVHDYVRDSVFPTSELIERHGETWIQYIAGVPLDRHIFSLQPLALVKAA